MYSQNNLPRTPVPAKRFLGSRGSVTPNRSFDLSLKHGFNEFGKQTTGVLNHQTKDGMFGVSPCKRLSDTMFSKTPADKGSKYCPRIILPQFKKIGSERKSMHYSSSNKIDLPTHQEKYSGFQVTPIVRLTAVNKPTFSPKEKQGVRVWIAPPDSLRASRLSITCNTTKDDADDNSAEELAPYETACLEFLRKKRKLFSSPDMSSENQSSEAKKPVSVLSEGSDLLRDEDSEHPSKKRKIVESITSSSSFQIANIHKRPALRDNGALECIDQSNSQAKRQKLDNIFPKIWDSFRNPIEVSHLSMKKFFERKVQASKSIDCDAGSLRSSRESSIQTDEECLGTTVHKVSTERNEQGDRMCQTPSESQSIEESGSVTPFGDSASEMSRLSKTGGGGSIRRRLAMSHQGSSLHLKKSEQLVRQGVTWKDFNEDRKRYCSRLHPLLDEGKADSLSGIPITTAETLGISSSLVSLSNSNEKSVLEKVKDIATIHSVKSPDEKDTIVIANKQGSPHLYTTSSDNQVNSAGLTTTSSTFNLLQNQEKKVSSEKIDVIRDSPLKMGPLNNSSVESLKNISACMSNQGLKIVGVKDDRINMKNATSESLQLEQPQFQSVVTTTDICNMPQVATPTFNFSSGNGIGEKRDTKAIFSFQSQNMQSERPKDTLSPFTSSAVSTGSVSPFIFSNAPVNAVQNIQSEKPKHTLDLFSSSVSTGSVSPFVFSNAPVNAVQNIQSEKPKHTLDLFSSSVSTGSASPFIFSGASATSELMPTNQSISNLFGFNNVQSHVACSSSMTNLSQSSTSISSSFVFQAGGSNTLLNKPEKAGVQNAESNMFSFQSLTSSHQKNGFGNKNNSIFSQTSMQPTDPSSKSTALFSAPQPSLQFSSQAPGFQVSAFSSRAMVPQSEAVPKSTIVSSFTGPTSQHQINQNPFSFGSQTQNKIIFGKTLENSSSNGVQQKPPQSFSFEGLQPTQNSACVSSSIESTFGVPQTSQNFKFGMQNSSQTFSMSQLQNTAFATSQISAKTQSSQLDSSQQCSMFSKSHLNSLPSTTESQTNMFGQTAFQNFNGGTFQSNSLKANNQFQQKSSFNFQARATSEALISSVNENKPYQFSATPQFNFSAVANSPITENKGSSFSYAATQPQGMNFNTVTSQFPSFGGGGSFTLGAGSATKTSTVNRTKRKTMRR